MSVHEAKTHLSELVERAGDREVRLVAGVDPDALERGTTRRPVEADQVHGARRHERGRAAERPLRRLLIAAERHVGDLGNIKAGDDGVATLSAARGQPLVQPRGGGQALAGLAGIAIAASRAGSNGRSPLADEIR